MLSGAEKLMASPKPELRSDDLRAIWHAKIANLRLAWQEFESRRLDLNSRPLKAIVELTQNCNFRCIMCPQSWEEKFKRYDAGLNMPLETFVKVADDLFPRAHVIDLRGFGETTILPYWPDVVDYLERFPYVVWHLVTNLGLPRDDTWDKMIRLGFSLGFSCDGATKETFEAIRVRSHFERIRHNLGVVRDAIRKYNRGQLYFISTIQKRNLHELRQIVELAAEFEVQEVQFKIVQPGQHSEGIHEMDPAFVTKTVEGALDAAIANKVQVTFNDWFFTQNVDPGKVYQAGRPQPRRTLHALPRYPDFDPTFWDRENVERYIELIDDASKVSVNQRCYKPYSFTYVNYLGEVGTCNHMMYPGMLVMGDLRTQSLPEIWNGEKYREFRQQLVTATPADPRCQWCFKHRLED